jgi:hypothetical protein
MKLIETTTAGAVDIMLTWATLGAELHHFNGAYWYIKISDDMVAVVSTGNPTYVTIEFMLQGQARDYLTTSSNCYDTTLAEQLDKFITHSQFV